MDNVGNITSTANYGPMIVDTTPPDKLVISTPTNEQYFNSQPILNDWNDGYDTNGVRDYRIEYVYDDGHSFSNMPYRTTTVSQRNHTPGEWEQGGVTIRVQAFDNAGNEGAWSDPVHYYYDSIKPTQPEVLGFMNPDVECGGYTNIANTTVDWSDSNGTGSDIKAYQYQINYPNNSLRSVWTVTFNNANSQYSGSLNEGAHYIRVRAQDMAGNWSDWSTDWSNPALLTEDEMLNTCSITLDTQKPTMEQMENLQLVEGAAFPTRSLQVNEETMLDEVCVEVEGTEICNTQTDLTYQLSELIRLQLNDWFSTNITTIDTNYLPIGTYNIDYYAKDMAGNKSDTYTFTVDILDNVPTVAILGASTATAGDAPFTLSADITEGNAPFTYLWSGACSGTASTYNFNPTTANTYTCTLTVTDADGDIVATSKTVTVTAQQAEQEVAGAQTGPQATGSYIALGTGGGEGVIEEEEEEATTEEQDVKGTQSCDNLKKVSGYIYVDKNNNDQKDADEKIFKDVRLTIYTEDENGNVTFSKDLTTNSDGYWETYVCTGDYKISVNSEDLPKNYSLDTEDVLGVSISEDMDEANVNIQVNDDRNFWQKNWIWILLVISGVSLTGYLVLTSKKED